MKLRTMNLKQRLIVILVIVTTLLRGCRSTEEYQRLSKAGLAYTSGMDKLLTAAETMRVDATSEEVLSSRNYNELKQFETLDRQRLETLEQLRKHNQLLSRYFNLLEELATSDTPAQAKEEIGLVVRDLNTIGKKLRGSDLIPNKSVFRLAAEIIVSRQMRGALRQELEQRKEPIRQEFLTQKVLLGVLGDSIGTDMEKIRRFREERQVRNPLRTNAIANEDKWASDRRTLFMATTIVPQFAAAQDAAGSTG